MQVAQQRVHARAARLAAAPAPRRCAAAPSGAVKRALPAAFSAPKRHCPVRRVVAHAVSAAEYYKTQPLPTIADVKPPMGPATPNGSDSDDAGEGEGEVCAPTSETALVPASRAGGSTALAKLPERVRVQFVVSQYYTHMGQCLKVVGAGDELGNWSVDKAPAMQWNEGHRWTLDTDMPTGESVPFKIVMHEQGGGTRWEDGQDRVIHVPASTAPAPDGGALPVGSVGVACVWGDTQGTAVVALPDKDAIRERLATLEARAEALKQQRRRAEERRATRAIAQRRGVAAANGAAPKARGGMIQVPLLDHPDSQLPRINGEAGARGEAAFDQLLAEIVDGSGGSQQEEEEEAAPLATLSERVLAATIDTLVAAVTEALARDRAPPGAVALGVAESDVLQAAAFLGELQAATAALEREAGMTLTESNAGMLLAESIAAAAAARSAAATDTEQEPAAVATLAPAVPQMESPAQPQAAASPMEVDSASAAIAAPATPSPVVVQAARRWRSAVGRVLAEAKAAEERSAARDGSLVFSAASLSLDVDPQELLLAALDRARERLAARAADPASAAQ